MNLRNYLEISSEVRQAIRAGRPVVALETTTPAHILGSGRAQAFVPRLEAAVRGEHAVPAWTAVLNGVLCVGLDGAQLARLCPPERPDKISRRDVPVAAALRLSGATTASAAMILASLAGIHLFASCGIGGVFGSEAGAHASADLLELRQTPVAVVCSGVKGAADARPALEYLETMGAPVVGLRTDEFPGFFTASSGCRLDYTARSEAEAARIAKVKWDLGLKGGVLIANRPSPENLLSEDEARAAAEQAMRDARCAGVRGKALTPFLLRRAGELTDGRALDAVAALTVENARAAARIAAEYVKL